MVTKDEFTKIERATYYDTSIQREFTYFEGYYENLPKNSRWDKNFKCVELSNIMANEKRAIMWLKFCDYYYPKNENEELYELDTAGWYSFDYKNKTMTPINWLDIYPHELATKGAAAYDEMCRKKNEIGEDLKKCIHIV